MTRREAVLCLTSAIMCITSGLVWLVGPWGLLAVGASLAVVVLFVVDISDDPPVTDRGIDA